MADDIQGAADEVRARVFEGSTPKRSPPARGVGKMHASARARRAGRQALVDLIRTGQGERGEVTHDVTDAAAAATREREEESKQSERKEREREKESGRGGGMATHRATAEQQGQSPLRPASETGAQRPELCTRAHRRFIASKHSYHRYDRRGRKKMVF